MATLKFDVEKLTTVKNKCDYLIKTINDLRDNLNENLTNLKNDWNTPAGKKFFAEQDTNWIERVKNYTDTADVIVKLLNKAISEYESIEEKAKGLKL